MITFEEYLDKFEHRIPTAVLLDSESANEYSGWNIVRVKSLNEKELLEDRIYFYNVCVCLIFRYPQCREMIINGVHRYEKTGKKFHVFYNRIENEDIQKDILPIGLHFLGV